MADTAAQTDPESLTESALARDAYALAAEAHSGQRRKGDDSPYIAHPVAVARLVREECGGDEEQLAATFLHDVVEDSDTSIEDIERRFGSGVAELVAAMTEDKSIEPYERRKEHHREQVESAGPRAVAIYVADKLANLRDMRSLYAAVGETAASRFNAPLDVRVRLWRRDLEMGERVAPGLGILAAFRAELDAFDAERATTA